MANALRIGPAARRSHSLQFGQVAPQPGTDERTFVHAAIERPGHLSVNFRYPVNGRAGRRAERAAHRGVFSVEDGRGAALVNALAPAPVRDHLKEKRP